MRRLIACLGLTLISGLAAQQPAWHTFMPPDSSFAVSLPAEPSIGLRLTQTPKGMLPTQTASASDRRRDFSVSWTEYPMDSPETWLNEGQYARVSRALLDQRGPVTVLAEQSERIGGIQGYLLRFRTDAGRIVEVHFAMAHRRFYQISAETADTQEERAAALRFLQSFAPARRQAA